jgi:hypothetical protein
MTDFPSFGRLLKSTKLKNIMQISKELLDELTGLQEDVAISFSDEHMVSGELYWTVVECLATAKLAEIRGEVIPDFV